jgi:histidine triad (HIT) family protein
MTPDSKVSNCAFCAIARGADESVEVVYEGATWIAFFPLNPATPGHTLVIPKEHVPNLWRVEPPLQDQLMSAVIQVGRAIDAGLHPEGMNLITSAGEIAEETVFHLHLHVVPRWEQDGFPRIWPEAGIHESAKLEDAARRIRAACADLE